MRPTRSCCLQHGRWKKGRAQQGICMIAHDWPLMCARHLWPGTFGVRIRSVPTKMTASRFLSPFISLLIAVTHPEHAREQKHPTGAGVCFSPCGCWATPLPQPLWEWRGESGDPQGWATPCGGREARVRPLTKPCGWRAQEPATVGWE